MLLGLSIHLTDGMSIVATILLSLLSSLIGLGNHWTLRLPKRKPQEDVKQNSRKWTFQPSRNRNDVRTKETKRNASCKVNMAEEGTKVQKEDHVPPGDVVIRYPKGSFLVVRCVEDVARELYFAPEEIEYLIEDAWVYRLISLIGTMMLMGGVICLANARIESQIAWAGSYMLLGSAYWIVAALPAKVHWDTSCYKVISETLSEHEIHERRNIFAKSKNPYPYTKSKSFTEALWKAIVATKDATWVRRGDHCPESQVWDDWLHMAKTQSCQVMEAMTNEEIKKKEGMKMFGIKTWEIPDWDPSDYLQQLFKEEKKAREGV